MTNDIRTYSYPLPGRIKAYTVLKDCFYTIIVNDSLSHSAKIKAYNHEIKHIENGDFQSELPADLIELLAHIR